MEPANRQSPRVSLPSAKEFNRFNWVKYANSIAHPQQNNPNKKDPIAQRISGTGAPFPAIFPK
jgi:hypothetical protein